MVGLPSQPFVIVEWLDAWKAATDDTTLEQVADAHKPVKCFSAGWLLRQDDVGVSIANEYSPDGSYRGRTFVPKAMIVDVHPMKLSKPRKAKHAKVTPSDSSGA